jgi:uncharacterized membrane protein YfcA
VPTWGVVYLLVLFGATAASVAQDRRKGMPAWRLVLDVAATVVLGVLFVAYYRPEITDALGRAAAPLLLAAVLVLTIGAHADTQRHEPDPDLSARQNLVAEHVGILLGVLLISPAIAFATLAAARAW